ncbi:MAG: exodeoxyribonuclease V subunit gamma, partial [Bacteroidetes bacterium]|nr:exodeoxyribonuclease V subunit gamma [Bacteroidota bacterium]
ADRNPLLPEDIADGSISIQSCYTVAREVEALYNYLVQLVDKKKARLSPRDIVVMVSNINAYAPYIKAVFSNAPYRFRYTIADESYGDSDTIFNALYAILSLTEDSFKAEEVLQLLDASLVRERFGITDTDRIRNIVNAANIRFGMEGHREDDTRFVSWAYGLRRIMYGICMSGGEEFSAGGDSFYPLDLLEGSDALEIVRFVHFVQVLMDSISERAQPRPIAGWIAYVEEVLHNLVYEPEDDADEDYTLLTQQLSAYNVVTAYMDEPVPWEVLSRSFLQALSGATRSTLFVNGGITFCSLVPMRSIPFKVVAMLGLNYDKFPRREQAAGFNLMEQQWQRGDRNIKESDKHLFLETMLSAREYLYISYIGQSAKDNTSLPPSALVDELVDYIEAGAIEPEKVRPQLVVRQPLQSFSHRYNGDDPRLSNYLYSAAQVPVPVTRNGKDLALPDFSEISLDELVRFFRNPIKAYYNKVLGIYYDDRQVLLEDTELFELDDLQQWELKNELLAAGYSRALREDLVKKGKLPLKNMAGVVLHEVDERVEPVRALYAEATKGAPEESIYIELMVDGSLLKGKLDSIFDGHLVQVSW